MPRVECGTTGNPVRTIAKSSPCSMVVKKLELELDRKLTFVTASAFRISMNECRR